MNNYSVRINVLRFSFFIYQALLVESIYVNSTSNIYIALTSGVELDHNKNSLLSYSIFEHTKPRSM
jgi:hypothetical protein